MITYRPFNAEVKGNPCVEVGDLISIGTKYMIIDSYVLERTLKGIQSLRDSIHADGQPVRKERVNGTNSEIAQLKGKTNKLIRTVDETRSEIGNLETKTETRFVQTDEAILAEAKRASEAESSLRVTADQIQANVNTVSYDLKNNYLTIAETESKISASESGILLSVSKDYETIANANSYYSSLQSQIDINAGNISLKVSKGSVISEINQTAEKVKISASKIDLTGYVTVSDLSGEGSTSINGANIITGTIRADSISNVGVLTVDNMSCGGTFVCTNYDASARAEIDHISALTVGAGSITCNMLQGRLANWCSFSFVDANGTTHDVSFIGTHSESVG